MSTVADPYGPSGGETQGERWRDEDGYQPPRIANKASANSDYSDTLRSSKPNHTWRVEAYEPGFWHALCSCGWVSASRAYGVKAAEQMGREHALSAAPAVEPEQETPPSVEVFHQSVGDALDAADRGDVVPAADVLAELDEAIAERSKTTDPAPTYHYTDEDVSRNYDKGYELGQRDERARIRRIVEDAKGHGAYIGKKQWLVDRDALLAAIDGGDDA